MLSCSSLFIYIIYIYNFIFLRKALHSSFPSLFGISPIHGFYSFLFSFSTQKLYVEKRFISNVLHIIYGNIVKNVEQNKSFNYYLFLLKKKFHSNKLKKQ